MSCPDTEQLLAFADHELDPAQHAQVNQHLAGCAACQHVVTEMRSVNAWGQGALNTIPVPEKVIPLPETAERQSRVTLFALAAVLAIGLFLAAWFISPVPTTETAVLNISDRSATNIAVPSASKQTAKATYNEQFSRWAEPYRQLRIQPVSVEEAGNYNPPMIQPYYPEGTTQ